MAQPVHVQQLLKLKQQAVQQQKAIQPQATPGPAAVQQKVLASRDRLPARPAFPLSQALPPGWGAHRTRGFWRAPASLPGTLHTPVVLCLGCRGRPWGSVCAKAPQGGGGCEMGRSIH